MVPMSEKLWSIGSLFANIWSKKNFWAYFSVIFYVFAIILCPCDHQIVLWSSLHGWDHRFSDRDPQMVLQSSFWCFDRHFSNCDHLLSKLWHLFQALAFMSIFGTCFQALALLLTKKKDSWANISPNLIFIFTFQRYSHLEWWSIQV